MPASTPSTATVTERPSSARTPGTLTAPAATSPHPKTTQCSQSRNLMLCAKSAQNSARKITWNLSLFPKTEGFLHSNLSPFQKTRTFLQTEPECLRPALSKTRLSRQLPQKTLHPTPYLLSP